MNLLTNLVNVEVIPFHFGEVIDEARLIKVGDFLETT